MYVRSKRAWFSFHYGKTHLYVCHLLTYKWYVQYHFHKTNGQEPHLQSRLNYSKWQILLLIGVCHIMYAISSHPSTCSFGQRLMSWKGLLRGRLCLGFLPISSAFKNNCLIWRCCLLAKQERPSNLILYHLPHCKFLRPCILLALMHFC